MRSYLRFAICVLAALSARYPASAQDNARHASLVLTARATADSVVLRWAPTTPGGWILANRIGYILERLHVSANGAVDRSSRQRLTEGTLLPWSLADWERRSPRGDRFAAVAAQALYGKSFAPGSKGSGGIEPLKNAADELSNRYGFALFAADNDPLTAEGLALRFVDRKVRTGEKWLYFLRTAAVDPTYAIDSAVILVDVAPAEPFPAPSKLAVQAGDGRLTLTWIDPPGTAYSAYHIERSENGGKSFTRLTSAPYVPMTAPGALEKARPSFTDTGLVNYRHYRYRVQGVSQFGELSKPAEVEGMARDLTPPPPPIVKNPEQTGKTSVRLAWQMPFLPGDMAGFVVARSANALTGYRQLTPRALPASAREYIDRDATDEEPYYMIGSVDTAGNVGQSLPLYATVIDSTPPAVPSGLSGSVDSNGVVRLRWHLGREKNLLGYRVLRANDPSHEFEQRTGIPVRDTTFTDTVSVNTLTRYTYYRIAAVNLRYSHSGMSPILALKRPDRIAPQPPVFTGVEASDSTVRLAWNLSPSTDVRLQHLYRRDGRGERWSEIAALRRDVSQYADRNLRKERLYEYQIVAEDSSGLRSEAAKPVQGRVYDTGTRPPVKNLTATLDPQKKAVHLRWAYAGQQKEECWFTVYRALGNRALMQYRSVPAREPALDDQGVFPGTYRYAVKVFTRTAESPMSETVSVEVPGGKR